MSRPAFGQASSSDNDDIYADEFNEFLRGSEVFQAAKSSSESGDQSTNTQEGEIILVTVDNIEAIPQYGCIVVTGLKFTPVTPDNILAPVLTASLFKISDETQDKPVAILQEGVPASGSGYASTSNNVYRAKLIGTTPVKANIIHEAHNSLKRVDRSGVMESSMGGDLAILAKDGTGEQIVYAQFNPLATKKQFQVIGVSEPNLIDCLELIDGVPGAKIIKVAMPYMMQRTPFDSLGGAVPVDPDIIYTYTSNVTRKAVITIDGEETEEFQEIIPRYLDGHIINANRMVQGGISIGGGFNTEMVDSNGVPTEWIESSPTGRMWYEDPEGEE